MHFQKLGQKEPGKLIPPGIHTLGDVLQYGRDEGVCPYFLVRRTVSIFV
jgi:DNA excision repair protein ERCC-2